MSGWTFVREGKVYLEHYSTSSQIKMTIQTEDPVLGTVYTENWFDYNEFDDLQKCIFKLAEILNGP